MCVKLETPGWVEPSTYERKSMTSTSQPKLVSEPWHDAGDGVLAVVGDLGVPDGLVLAQGWKTISPYWACWRAGWRMCVRACVRVGVRACGLAGGVCVRARASGRGRAGGRACVRVWVWAVGGPRRPRRQ